MPISQNKCLVGIGLQYEVVIFHSNMIMWSTIIRIIMLGVCFYVIILLNC